MSSSGIISLLIIIITVIISYQGFNNRGIMERYKFSVEKILVSKEYYRVITSSFLHVNWFHLIFNMLSLYIFSGSIEAILGPVRFLLIYFGSMIGGDLLALWIHRNDGSYSSVGASGAVCGLIFGAIAVVPGMSVGIFPLPISVPGWIYGLLFVLLCIYGIRSGRGSTGHEAHLGGGITGMCIAILMVPQVLTINYFPILAITIPTLFFLYMLVRHPSFLLVDSFFSKRKDKDFYSIDQRYNARKADIRKEVDRLLEKIHRKGINSLTTAEKDFLKEHADKI